MLIASPGVWAGDEQDPEIQDSEDDADEHIDIISVWFWERVDQPDDLYVSMKIQNLNPYKIQQTFSVSWDLDGVEYACSFHILFYRFDLYHFSAGEYINRAPGGGPNYITIDNGNYDIINEMITWKIPKDIIGNPEPGDVLTNTGSNAFQRFGIIGQIGFSRVILDSILFTVFGRQVWDHAPDEGYGIDYTIQY